MSRDIDRHHANSPPQEMRDRERRRFLSARTIRAIMRREFIDVLRDRGSLFLTFLYPISMLIMYGYGIRYDVDNVPLTVLDYDRSVQSRQLTERLFSSRYFRLVREATNPKQINEDLATDASRAALVIPRDFAAKLASGEVPTLQAIVDGADSNTATIAQGYLLGVIGQYAQPKVGRHEAMPLIDVESRIWYNPELKSVNFIVPGVIAVIMMIVGAMLTALSIVKEKQRGTLEQILVSPIRPLEMMIGKLIPYLIIGFIDLTIIVVAGYVIFEVPIRGSLLQLGVFAFLYLVASLGLGVFVSTIADTMEAAMLAAIFISLMPSILLSGFAFPLETMPLGVRVVSYLFPGRYFVTAIRGIYLKGVGLEVLWPQALLLLLFGVVIVGLSANRFQEKLG